jgi:hypothetical protein
VRQDIIIGEMARQGWRTAMVLNVTRPEGNLANAKPLDLVAIGQSGVLPGRELIINRGDLVQPIDDVLVDHRGGIAPTLSASSRKSVASVDIVVFGSVSSISC